MKVTFFNLKNKNYIKKKFNFHFSKISISFLSRLQFFGLRDFDANYNEQIFLFLFNKDFKKK